MHQETEEFTGFNIEIKATRPLPRKFCKKTKEETLTDTSISNNLSRLLDKNIFC